MIIIIPRARAWPAVLVSASRSNIAASQAPQTALIIKQEEIKRQLAISGNSAVVRSGIRPSYTPSRGKMNFSGETLRGRTPLILVERIEIVQGGNAINGLGATGGTINMVTKRLQPGAFNLCIDVQTALPGCDIRAATSSDKTVWNVNGRNGKLEHLFALSYEDQGLYPDGAARSIGTDTTQGDLMDARSYDALLKVGYCFDDNRRLQLSVKRCQIKSRANYMLVAGDRALGLPSTPVDSTPPGIPPRIQV